tara:strand:+ start:419 stop:721 length:303 start_codon:yes stop_codon:yes gene_type:complete
MRDVLIQILEGTNVHASISGQISDNATLFNRGFTFHLGNMDQTLIDFARVRDTRKLPKCKTFVPYFTELAEEYVLNSDNGYSLRATVGSRGAPRVTRRQS